MTLVDFFQRNLFSYTNLVNCSNIEAFIFFSPPDPSRIWKLLMSILFFIAIRLFAWIQQKSDFFQFPIVDLLTKTSTGMSGLQETCLDSECQQKASRNKDLLWSPSKPLGDTAWFLAYSEGSRCLSGKERRLLSWETARKNLKAFWGPWELEFTQMYRHCRQSLMATAWLGFFAPRASESSIYEFLVTSQQSIYRKVYTVSCYSYWVHVNQVKLKWT